MCLCLEIMKNHLLLEKSLAICEYVKSNLENKRIPNDFDYLMVKVLLYRDQSIDFQSRSIDWLIVRRGPPP